MELPEIKGEDYFEIGGCKFNRDVKLVDAVEVLRLRNEDENIKKMHNPVCEKIERKVIITDAQSIIDSIDTQINTPRFRC